MYKGEKALSLSQADKFVGNRGLNRWLLAGGEAGGRLETLHGACGAPSIGQGGNRHGVDLLKARIYDLLLLRARHDGFARVDDEKRNRFVSLFPREFRMSFGSSDASGDGASSSWLTRFWDDRLL